MPLHVQKKDQPEAAAPPTPTTAPAPAGAATKKAVPPGAGYDAQAAALAPPGSPGEYDEYSDSVPEAGYDPKKPIVPGLTPAQSLKLAQDSEAEKKKAAAGAPLTRAQILAGAQSAAPGVSLDLKLESERFRLDLSGAVVKLLDGPLKAEVGAAWPLNAAFKASYGGVSFQAKLGKTSWSASLTFPGTSHAPQLPLVEKIVGDAFRGMGRAANRIAHSASMLQTDDPTFDDLTPDLGDVSAGVSALSGMYDQSTMKPGQVSAGVTAQGPIGPDKGQMGGAGGVSVVGTVTVTM